MIKELSSTSNPIWYIREPDGSLVAMFISSYPYYYHFDALGSTRMLTDETGHITDSYSYDAWGNVTGHYPYSISQPYQYVGQLGYYTHYQDSNLPLLQLGVRFYEPQIGRFGQVDPVFGYNSAFCYAANAPLSAIDPDGEKKDSKETGYGLACVDSSCYNSPAYKKIGGTMSDVPDLGGPGQRLPNPPQPCPGKKRQNCAIADGLDIPPGTQMEFDGAPQQPPRKRTLKFHDGWTCEYQCSPSGVRLKCRHTHSPWYAGFFHPYWP